jgi:hypothetical protein
MYRLVHGLSLSLAVVAAAVPGAATEGTTASVPTTARANGFAGSAPQRPMRGGQRYVRRAGRRIRVAIAGPPAARRMVPRVLWGVRRRDELCRRGKEFGRRLCGRRRRNIQRGL